LDKLVDFQCAVTETEGNTQKEKEGDQRVEAEGKILRGRKQCGKTWRGETLG
jgi:hypothetical protein